jgi:phage protein U
MIGYFGSVTFQTSDKRICTFRNLKRAASSSFSDHKRYRKKSEREFEGPENQTVSFEMQFIAGHGVRPWHMLQKIIKICENGTVCSFVLGGRKVGDGKWTIDSVDADYKEVWNRGELVSVSVNVTATEYH